MTPHTLSDMCDAPRWWKIIIHCLILLYVVSPSFIVSACHIKMINLSLVALSFLAPFISLSINERYTMVLIFIAFQVQSFLLWLFIFVLFSSYYNFIIFQFNHSIIIYIYIYNIFLFDPSIFYFLFCLFSLFFQSFYAFNFILEVKFMIFVFLITIKILIWSFFLWFLGFFSWSFCQCFYGFLFYHSNQIQGFCISNNNNNYSNDNKNNATNSNSDNNNKWYYTPKQMILHGPIFYPLFYPI